MQGSTWQAGSACTHFGWHAGAFHQLGTDILRLFVHRLQLEQHATYMLSCRVGSKSCAMLLSACVCIPPTNLLSLPCPPRRHRRQEGDCVIG
jgi:hypothetical protein